MAYFQNGLNKTFCISFETFQKSTLRCYQSYLHVSCHHVHVKNINPKKQQNPTIQKKIPPAQFCIT